MAANMADLDKLSVPKADGYLSTVMDSASVSVKFTLLVYANKAPI